MRDWVRVDRQERLRAGKLVRDARLEVARINDQVEALRAELGHALARVGEPPAALGETLAALLARTRLVIDRIGGRVQRGRPPGAGSRRFWLRKWPGSTAGDWRLPPLGLGPGGLGREREPPCLINSASGMRLPAKPAPPATSSTTPRRSSAGLPPRPPPCSVGSNQGWRWGLSPTGNRSVASLVDRLGQAGEAKTRRLGWLGRLDEERTKLGRAQATLTRATEVLVALAVEAGVATVEDLPAAIRRSGEIEADLADLRRFDEQIDTCAGVLTREALLAAVEGLDEATLAARLGAVGDTLKELEVESNRLGEEIGGARARLDAMDTRVGAAEAGQLVETHAARLHAEVEHYARLKLASSVLRDAIERHRKEKQGPVHRPRRGVVRPVDRGGRSWGCRPTLDDKKEPILRGVRAVAPGSGDEEAPSNPLLDVAEMSEGTADQLYLALRLASLSVHLDDPRPRAGPPGGSTTS